MSYCMSAWLSDQGKFQFLQVTVPIQVSRSLPVAGIFMSINEMRFALYSYHFPSKKSAFV